MERERRAGAVDLGDGSERVEGCGRVKSVDGGG
jgi:hypothetical protein